MDSFFQLSNQGVPFKPLGRVRLAMADEARARDGDGSGDGEAQRTPEGTSRGIKRRLSSPLLDYLHVRQRQTEPQGAKRDLRGALEQKQPLGLVERELPPSLVSRFDKTFASKWMDEKHVLVGTKCNHLLVLDVENNTCREVELPCGRSVPDHAGIVAGIHSIDINPSRTLVATSAQHPADCAVLRLEDMTPVQAFSVHQDWIFGVCWLADDAFVSASRDSTVALWKVSDTSDNNCNAKPLARSEFKLEDFARGKKFRDVKYDPRQEEIFVLDTEGFLLKMDPRDELKISSTIALPYDKELTCMAMNDSLVCVGSQSFVTAYDTRSQELVFDVKGCDSSLGTRSLNFQTTMLTCGGGQGHISFLDLRTQQYLDLDETGREPKQYYTTGRGWLDKNEVYYSYFHGRTIPNACYTQCWDQSGTRLFAGGGPLPFGLRGCYMGIW